MESADTSAPTNHIVASSWRILKPIERRECGNVI
ncbi:hypothetical protein PVOR_15314 [Paenibacillus vortex V453]|uniref:Uncharacterized protein n=1 Tax=Paenibacillus vortex V453 TaxID=715225 RepID=A0A2R9SUH1_9BACL|nr:hypothetical protein PVOR_15314 [Paenibacillus vortex V453]